MGDFARSVMGYACVIVACMTAGCTHLEHPGPTPRQFPASATTRPTLSDAELTKAVCGRLSPWSLGWGNGDVEMVLFPGGHYVMEFYDSGLWAATSGRWQLHGGTLQLTQDDAFGKAEPMRTLRPCVAGEPPELLLVPDSREQSFQSYGVVRETCFRDYSSLWWGPTSKPTTVP